ncbi:MAG: shikimate kinase [Acidimicrobiales bacterium]
MSAPERVLLIGMMGAGKSTTGHLLAGRLGWSYLDTDEEVERCCGRTVAELWQAVGEAAFRAEESRVLAEATTAEGPAVISAGGGAILDPDNRTRIRDAGLVVWLRAEVATLTARVGAGKSRPLLDGGSVAALGRILEQRAQIYAEIADLAFDVDHLSPAQAADRILDAVQERRRA